MATLLPPPKRKKIDHTASKPEPEVSTPSPSVVVQFVADDDGSSIAPAVNIPANLTREALEALVNKLRPQVGNRLISFLLLRK